MTTAWNDFEHQAPHLADHVRDRIQQHGLALLASLTADGSPCISGIEPVFHGDHLWLAMMPDSVKGRDRRLALHNATIGKDVTHGDVKDPRCCGGRRRPQPAGTPDVGAAAELFHVELTRVASIRVDTDHLVIPPGDRARRCAPSPLLDHPRRDGVPLLCSTPGTLVMGGDRGDLTVDESPAERPAR